MHATDVTNMGQFNHHHFFFFYSVEHHILHPIMATSVSHSKPAGREKRKKKARTATGDRTQGLLLKLQVL